MGVSAWFSDPPWGLMVAMAAGAVLWAIVGDVFQLRRHRLAAFAVALLLLMAYHGQAHGQREEFKRATPAQKEEIEEYAPATGEQP